MKNKEIILKETLYDTLLANDVPEDDIGCHESDLHIRVTPQTVEIIQAYLTHNGLPKNSISTFRSRIEGDGIWYEQAFGYMPFWRGKLMEIG